MTKIYKTHSLLPHNTFGIDATAENFVEFSLVDDIVASVGTVNLDYRSLYLHFECGTLMYGSKAVIDLRNDSLDTIAKSREITLDNIKSYYRGTMFDALLRLLAPLL